MSVLNSNNRISLDDVLEIKCTYCGEIGAKFTQYIGFGTPNVKCIHCGEEWIECPSQRLHIKNDVEEQSE